MKTDNKNKKTPKEEKSRDEQEETKSIKKEKNTKKGKKGVILVAIIVVTAIVIILIALINPIIHGKKVTEITIKSSLERVVEMTELETASIKYDVIAKKCKNEKKCNLESNDIKEFEYVVSCKGIITIGIDFSEIKINVDEDKKKVVITVPDAKLTGKPTIKSYNFLNGSDLPANTIADARKVCEETVKNKSKKDEKVLQTAKQQAITILEEYYKQWIKAYNSDYELEVK